MFFWNGEPATAGIYADAQRKIFQLQRELQRDRGFGWHFIELIRSLPVVRWGVQWRDGRKPAAPRGPRADLPIPPRRPRSASLPSSSNARFYADGPPVTDRGRIDEAIARFRVNKRSARRPPRRSASSLVRLGAQPAVQYDLALHPFRISDDGRRQRYGYPALRHQADRRELGANFAWCADVFEHATERCTSMPRTTMPRAPLPWQLARPMPSSRAGRWNGRSA